MNNEHVDEWSVATMFHSLQMPVNKKSPAYAELSLQ
jgi:hypothetical protein